MTKSIKLFITHHSDGVRLKIASRRLKDQQNILIVAQFIPNEQEFDGEIILKSAMKEGEPLDLPTQFGSLAVFLQHILLLKKDFPVLKLALDANLGKVGASKLTDNFIGIVDHLNPSLVVPFTADENCQLLASRWLQLTRGDYDTVVTSNIFEVCAQLNQVRDLDYTSSFIDRDGAAVVIGGKKSQVSHGSIEPRALQKEQDNASSLIETEKVIPNLSQYKSYATGEPLDSISVVTSGYHIFNPRVVITSSTMHSPIVSDTQSFACAVSQTSADSPASAYNPSHISPPFDSPIEGVFECSKESETKVKETQPRAWSDQTSTDLFFNQGRMTHISLSLPTSPVVRGHSDVVSKQKGEYESQDMAIESKAEQDTSEEQQPSHVSGFAQRLCNCIGFWRRSEPTVERQESNPPARTASFNLNP